MRVPLVARLLLLIAGLFVAPLGPARIDAQQNTSELARIDINIREVAYVEDQPDTDPLQVETFSRSNLAIADGYADIAS